MRIGRWTPLLAGLALFLFPGIASSQYAAGRGSLGGSVGVPYLVSTGELRAGQKPRLIGKGHFQYVISPELRLSFRGGFGWLGFDDETPAPFPMPSDRGGFDATRIDQLVVFNPFTAALQFTRRSGDWLYFLGAGPGITRVNIMNDRETIFDPVTFDRHDYWSLGLGAEGGAEYFLPANRNVSFDLTAALNYLLQDHADSFPSGYAGKHGLLDLSFGVNVYFSPFGGPRPPAPAPTPEPAPEATPEPEAPADTSSSESTP